MVGFTRFDLEIIKTWIPQHARVLDLGCGEGDLIASLFSSHNATGYGIETDSEKIQQCILKGVPVIEQNIDEGLHNFTTQSFDTVIIAQSIQELDKPQLLLQEIVRVGRQGIVTFPNFGYWKNRWMLASAGRMPESNTIPHKWHSTPNIHLCTCWDFEALCAEHNIAIRNKLVIDHRGRKNRMIQRWSNLLGELALYQITAN